MKIGEAINKLGELVVIKKWEPIGSIKMFDREQDMSKLYYGTWELTLLERSPIGVNPDSTESKYRTAGQQFGSKYLQQHSHNKSLYWSLPGGSYGYIDAFHYSNDKSGNVVNIGSGNVATDVQTGDSGNIPPSETVYFYKRIA